MVTQWGMSDTIGPLQYEEQQGETFLGYSQTQRHNMSNETALAIDGEIRRLVEGGHKRATEVITKHVDQLHAIAGALLELETLTGEEIKALIAGNADRPRQWPQGTDIARGRHFDPAHAASQGPVRQSGAARRLIRELEAESSGRRSHHAVAGLFFEASDPGSAFASGLISQRREDA